MSIGLASERNLKVAMIGLGWFGRLHVEAWQEVQGTEIVAICDHNPEMAVVNGPREQDAFHRVAEGRSASFVSEAPFFTDPREMLATIACDLVVVTTPERDHASVARIALESGRSVVIEKPFTTDATEAWTLTRLARSKGLQIFVGNILRWDQRYLHAIEGCGLNAAPPRFASLQRHFQSSALAVYGRVHPFFGACIHDIDLAIWVQGRRPARVLGRTVRGEDGVAIIAATGLLEWNNGALITIQNSWLLPRSTPAGFIFDSSFYAEGKAISIRSEPVVSMLTDEAVIWPELFFWPEVESGRAGALVRELSHFAACARLGCESTRLPVEQACWGIEVAEALVRSSEIGAWVDLPASNMGEEEALLCS